jgi:hypothetical protein
VELSEFSGGNDFMVFGLMSLSRSWKGACGILVDLSCSSEIRFGGGFLIRILDAS